MNTINKSKDNLFDDYIFESLDKNNDKYLDLSEFHSFINSMGPHLPLSILQNQNEYYPLNKNITSHLMQSYTNLYQLAKIDKLTKNYFKLIFLQLPTFNSSSSNSKLNLSSYNDEKFQKSNNSSELLRNRLWLTLQHWWYTSSNVHNKSSTDYDQKLRLKNFFFEFFKASRTQPSISKPSNKPSISFNTFKKCLNSYLHEYHLSLPIPLTILKEIFVDILTITSLKTKHQHKKQYNTVSNLITG